MTFRFHPAATISRASFSSSWTCNTCVTAPLGCRCTISFSSCPLLWFQHFTLPSSEPVRSRRSPRSNAIAVTRAPGDPRDAATNRPSLAPPSTSHRCTFPPSSALTATSNPWLYAQATTGRSWPSFSFVFNR